MVNPLDFIPKLSGFSPMPLGIMAPFMGYQSAALAYNFGLNYEFGKRVIKSMSNEKFNKIAEDPILLNELTSRHHDVLLKAFIHEVPKVDKIQDLIIKKMVELEFAKIKVMPELIAQIPKGFLEGIFELGNTGTTSSPPPQKEPGDESPHTKPPPPTKTIIPDLQSFSALAVVTQQFILQRITKIWAIKRNYDGTSPTVRKNVHIKSLRSEVGMWRQKYISVGGYKNPTPEGTFSGMSNSSAMKGVLLPMLRDWHTLL